MTTTIRSGLSFQKVQTLIKKIPGAIAKKISNDEGISSVFWSHFTHTLMKRIHEEFLIKSGGGTDSLGVKWKPLKRSTIAKRASRHLRRKGPRRSLSKIEDKKWRGIYASRYARLRATLGEAGAKQMAAKIAWAVLKSEGAKTLLERYGGKRLKIMIDKGQLEKSLRPGRLSNKSYSPPPNQKVGSTRNGISLKFLVPYAGKNHRARPFWARNIDPWIKEASVVGINAVVQHLKGVLS